MSEELITDLRERIATRCAVVFVGTGVSQGAAQTNVASWKGFLEAGIGVCEAARRTGLPADWARCQREALARGDLAQWLHVAEAISQQLDAPRGAGFQRWLRETVGALEATRPGVIEALGALDAPLITTNYDDLLEDVTGRRPITWRQDPHVARFVHERCLEDVLHIHGHWEDAESIILGIRSYERVLGHHLVQRALRTLLVTHTVVFVGYGGGLEDPDFGLLRQWATDGRAAARHRHYRLCLACEAEEIAASHDGERIFPLVYGDSHDDLEPFLRSLAPPGGGGR